MELRHFDRSAASLRDVRARTYARRALAALDSGDWYGAYVSTASWSSEHDGDWLTDTWLLMSACDVANGHTRGTVHPLHLGLRDRIDRPQDRAVLLWARGQLLMSKLGDPTGAMANFEVARDSGPSWLQPHVVESIAEATGLMSQNPASVTGGTVPAVPPFAGQDEPPSTRPADGDMPIVFDELRNYFTGRHLRVI